MSVNQNLAIFPVVKFFKSWTIISEQTNIHWPSQGNAADYLKTYLFHFLKFFVNEKKRVG